MGIPYKIAYALSSYALTCVALTLAVCLGRPKRRAAAASPRANRSSRTRALTHACGVTCVWCPTYQAAGHVIYPGSIANIHELARYAKHGKEEREREEGEPKTSVEALAGPYALIAHDAGFNAQTLLH